MRLLVKFGSAHALTHIIDNDPGKPGERYVETACGFKQWVAPDNRDRFMIAEDGGHIGCYICNDKINPRKDDDDL